MNSFFYSIELTYYSTSFLCEAMVNRSGFNVVPTNSSDAHAYEHVCSPKFLSARLCNKRAIVREGPGYPSNQSRISVTFAIVAHWMAKHIIKLVANHRYLSG